MSQTAPAPEIQKQAEAVMGSGLLEELLTRTTAKAKTDLEELLARERVERAPVDIIDGVMVPKNMDGMWRIAQMLARAGPGAVPDAYRLDKDDKPYDFQTVCARVFTALSVGMPLGLTPAACLQWIALINGRPSMWGDAVLGVVMRSKDYEWHNEGIDWDGGTELEPGPNAFAWCTVKRKGHEAYTRKFSVRDAKRAGKWYGWDNFISRDLKSKDVWACYPQRMLQMRARAWCLRDKFADALMGLSIAEEVLDIDQEPTAARHPAHSNGQAPAPEANPLDALKAADKGRGQRETKEPQGDTKAPEPETPKPQSDTPRADEPPATLKTGDVSDPAAQEFLKAIQT